MAKKWKYIGSAIAIVVVLAVAGPFVYIHFIEGDAPAPLSLSDSTATTSGSTSTSAVGGTTAETSAATGIDGAWTAGSGSQAGYRVQETLFGQSTTAVGRTSEVTGSMTVAANKITAATFSVKLANVKSDQSNRDNQFKGRIMSVSQYPTADFKLTTPIDLNTEPADGKTITVKGTGDLTLHGTTKSVTVDLSAKRSGNSVQVSTSIPIAFSDYNIPNPTFGPAEVGDTGTIEVLLTLSH